MRTRREDSGEAFRWILGVSFRPAVAAWLIVVAACSASPAPTTSTVVEEPADPTTTDATTTTTVAESTTTVPEVVALGLRGQGVFPTRPGVTYVHDFLVPVGWTFDKEGWSIEVVGERFLGFQNEADDRPLAVTVTFMPRDSVEDLLTFVQDHEKSADVTEPHSTTVAGIDAVTLDVLVPPGLEPGNQGLELCWSPFAGPVWVEERMADGIAYLSILVGCAWNRVWIMEVDGVSVVIHAGDVSGDPDAEPRALEPVEPLIDEFLSALDFDPPFG